MNRYITGYQPSDTDPRLSPPSGGSSAQRPTGWSSSTNVPEHLPTCAVHEGDPTPVPIGLLDASGVPIYRVPEKVVLGFQGPAPRGGGQ